MTKRRNSDKCNICGLKYDDFRTGETYRGAYASLWRTEDDPTLWRNKNRHGVLGAWHGYKMLLWDEHLKTCEAQRDWEKEQSRKGKKTKGSILWESIGYDDVIEEVPF
jgi:hypothetical protein